MNDRLDELAALDRQLRAVLAKKDAGTATGPHPAAKPRASGGGAVGLIVLLFLAWWLFLRSPSPSSVPTSTPQPPAVLAPVSVLLDLAGSGIKKSRPFTATEPWTLGYDFDCSGFGSKGNFIVSVYGIDGELADVAVNELAARGHDTTAGYSTGAQYLEMNSECAWSVRVTGR